MAAKKQDEEVIVDVAQAYSRTEKYIEDNKKGLTIITVMVVIIVGAYFGWKYLIMAPKEIEAQEQMWKAEDYFAVDSLNLAVYGDGNYLGFQYIIDEYGGTKAANLAHYYMGVISLRQGNFQMAIEYLEDFDSGDEILGPIATGAIGDAYVEMNNVEEGVNYYKKAADQRNNDFTTPIYLMKAAKMLEQLNRWSEAYDIYERIQTQHPESREGKNIEKYLARAEAYKGE